MYNNITSLKNATEPSEIGGLAYFLVYISEYLPYVILISLGEIVGIIGNVRKYKKLISINVIMCFDLHPNRKFAYSGNNNNQQRPSFANLYTCL